MVKKYYAVAKGKKIGVFETWKECEENVKGIQGAIYKSFLSIEDAKNFISSNLSSNEISENKTIEEIVKDDLKNGITSVFVDGSYNKYNKKIGYGILIIPSMDKSQWIQISNCLSNDQLNKYGKHLNISGEIIGTLESIKNCVKQNVFNIKVYYDYAGIEMWANNKWSTNSPISIMYKQELAKLKTNYKINLTFQKVKAHSNIQYNEIVDKLAKKSVS